MPRTIFSATPRQAGFTLLEVAIVLLIMGILITITATTTSSVINQKRRNETQEKMKVIDTALVNFVMQNQRLPCPADGTLDSTAGVAAAGTETLNVAKTACTLAFQTNGIVPWKSLGVSLSDATDSWGNMFTYRVDEVLVQAATGAPAIGPMNLTYCTAGGTAAATGAPSYCNTLCTAATFTTACTSTINAIANKGVRVQDKSGNALATPSNTPQSAGAAYVLISHGENLEGGYAPTGTFVAAGTTTSGTQEQKNFANQLYTPGMSYLVDDTADYTSTTSHFDDFVSRPTLLTVIGKATLGPRAY